MYCIYYSTCYIWNSWATSLNKGNKGNTQKKHLHTYWRVHIEEHFVSDQSDLHTSGFTASIITSTKFWWDIGESSPPPNL